MFEEYKNIIELHCHSAGISECSDIPGADLVRYYKEAGYSGLVITNHFYPWQPKSIKAYEKYKENYVEEYRFIKDIGEKTGIKVYLGMEIRFEENFNDYLLYGIDEDFVINLPRDFETFEEFVPYIRQYENIIVIQAHPFRNGMVLMDSCLLDGIEVYNLHPNHNSRAGLAAKYAEMEDFEICTCGSDFHHIGQHALAGLMTKELPEDNKALVKCIREEQLYKAGKSTIMF